jgi:hypothetical protein
MRSVPEWAMNDCEGTPSALKTARGLEQHRHESREARSAHKADHGADAKTDLEILTQAA